MNRKTLLRKTAVSGVIAALYVALTLAFAPISYLNIQFRISEALMLMPLLFPESWIGLTVGCLLANLLNPEGAVIWDVIFGTLATALAGLVTSKMNNKFLAPLPTVILNGVIVGVVITFAYTDVSGMSTAATLGLMGLNMLTVAAGETAVCYVLGVPLVFAMSKTGLADLINNGKRKEK
jgi:uncharacterized membrane protein